MANYTDTNMLIMRMRIAYYSQSYRRIQRINCNLFILTISRKLLTTNSQIALGSVRKGASDCSQEIGLEICEDGDAGK